MTTVATICLILALIPAILTVVNAFCYRSPPLPDGRTSTVSVLIPARNEELSIASAVRAALASRDVDLEVVVLDDHSTDRTAEVISNIARTDRRVRLISAPPLPPGW